MKKERLDLGDPDGWPRYSFEHPLANLGVSEGHCE